MIRILTLEELPIIQQLAQQTWPDTFGEILSAEQIDYMLEWMYNLPKLESQLQAGHIFALAEREGIPIGFIALEPAFPDKNTVRIHKIYVLPTLQKSGAGRELMQFAEKFALQQDFRFLHLNVNRFNKATAFYKHLGFSIEREEDIDIGNGFLMEDFVMIKSLIPDK